MKTPGNKRKKIFQAGWENMKKVPKTPSNTQKTITKTQKTSQKDKKW